MATGPFAAVAAQLSVSPAGPLHLGLSTSAELELSAFFLIGLLGGAHCLGMCGPLVTMYAKRFGESTGSNQSTNAALTFREIRQHLLFNGGRTVSYAVLGGLFGLAGMLFYDAADVVLVVGDSVRAVAGLLVGVVIVVTGVRYASGRYGTHEGGLDLPFVRRLGTAFASLQSRLDDWAGGPKIAGLGLVHGILPCPLLYPAYLYAFVNGSPLMGVLALGALGLGTIPALFVYGTVITSVDAGHRDRIHRALGVAFVVLGVMPIAHSLALFGVQIPHIEPPIYQPLVV